MSYFAGHMKKLKRADLRWAQIHNQREKESKSNRDIDKSRSHLNYDLANGGKVNYQQKVDDRLKEGLKPKARVRKDSVLCNSWVITSDKGFFDRIGEQEEKRFFKEAYQWFADRYGKENIAFAVVHRDEHTPHMHLGVIPITKDGRLSSKELFNPQRLKEIQDKFPKYMQERGFDLKRGIPGKGEHLEPQRWKVEQEKKKLREVSKHLEQTKHALERHTEALRGIQEQEQWIDGIEVKEKGIFAKDKVEVSKQDWEYVKNKAKQAVVLKYELKQKDQEMERLRQQNEWMKTDREKARKYDRLCDVFGRERLEAVLDHQQRERTKAREKEDRGLEFER